MKIVEYLRVSTTKQGESGLGIEAQMAAVRQYATHNNGTIVASYREIESGKHNDRPELQRALMHAKRAKATLVVAKLDRLSRNAAFLLTLMDGNVPIVCCDNPHANQLTIGILAVIAQDEAKRISQRTKDALAAYKARGGKLGAARPECQNMTAEHRIRGSKLGVKVRKDRAKQFRSEILPIVQALREEGLSYRLIADRLNEDGWQTPRGRSWNEVHVCNLLTSSGLDNSSI